jgi:hypothetical protein
MNGFEAERDGFSLVVLGVEVCGWASSEWGLRIPGVPFE